MNADPAVQLRLLDLQAADTALTQLAHRRRSLPQLAALAERRQRLDALGHQVVEVRTSASDIEAAQRKLENEVDLVRTRAERDNQRLLGGGLPGKELERIQHEIESLARRQATLEDDLLEIMESAETTDSRLGELTAQLEALRGEVQTLTGERDAAFAEIDAAAAARETERSGVAAEIDPDLLAVYEKARAHGGTGAALLRQRRCEGCHMELSGSELSAVRAASPDTVVRCENCRCVLVRTAESGL